MRKSLLAFLLNIINKAATAVLFLLLARLAGASDAGVYSLGLSYMLVSGALVAGLDDLLIREASREPAELATWFSNLAGLRAVLSVALWLGIALIVSVINYSPDTTRLVIALSSALLPEGLVATSNAILIVRSKFGLATVLAAVVALLKIGAGTAVLLSGLGLSAVVAVSVVSGWLSALLFMTVASRQAQLDGLHRYLSFQFWLKQVRQIAPFLLIGFLSTLEYQLDVLILSAFRREEEIGWYSSTTTFLWVLWMVPVAYRMVYFPIFSRHAKRSPERVGPLYWQSIQYLLTFILPVAVGTSLLAPSIIKIVYGDSGYEPSYHILAVIVWALPFVYAGVPNMRLLLAFDRQKNAGHLLLVTLGVNVVANLLFIPLLGGLGAAISRVLSSIAFWLASWLGVRDLTHPAAPFRAFSPMIIGSAVSALGVWFIRDQPVFLVVLTGALLYSVTLSLTGGFPVALVSALRRQIKE